MKNLRQSCLIIILLILGACSTFGTRTVSISETEIQTKLAEKLSTPITLLKLFDVQLSNPLVKLESGTNRMSTQLDADVENPFGKAFKGQARISGLPRFDAATNSVVLSEVKIESLKFDGLESKYADVLTALGKEISADMLQDIPLYTLKPNDLRNGSTTYQPSDFKVSGKQLQVTLTPQ